MPEPKTVLIIDDDKMLGAILCNLLGYEGFEVYYCDDGSAALNLAKEKCFDIIITDFRMPGMNGVETTRSLRVQCPHSFIIGLSSDQREKDFLASGANAFVKKPCSFQDIMSILRWGSAK